MILHVLVARWLSPNEFGAFAVMFSFLILMGCCSNGFVIEPLSVFGPSTYASRLRPYLLTVLKIHFVLNFLLSLGVLLILFGVMYLGNIPETVSYVVVVLTSPFILFFWVARRVCYARGAPMLAVFGSTLYTLILLMGVYGLEEKGLLSPLSVFLIMGGGGVIAGAGVWSINFTCIERETPKVLTRQTFDQRVVWREHIRFGKWIVLGAIPNWVTKMSYVPLIGLLLGLPQAGAFRAIQNLILPVQQILIAIGSFILPWLVKKKGEQSSELFMENGQSLTKANVFLVGCYLLPLFLFGEEILQWLYQSDYYGSFTYVIPILGLVAIVSGLNHAWSTLLKAMECSYGIFQARCLGAVISILVGWSLIDYLGIWGAALGLLISSIFEIFVLFFVRNKILGLHRQEKGEQESLA